MSSDSNLYESVYETFSKKSFLYDRQFWFERRHQIPNGRSIMLVQLIAAIEKEIQSLGEKTKVTFCDCVFFVFEQFSKILFF